jgi:hypothetical protein
MINKKPTFSEWAFGKDCNDQLTYGQLSERWNNLHKDLFLLPTSWKDGDFYWAKEVKEKCLPVYLSMYQEKIKNEIKPT